MSAEQSKAWRAKNPERVKYHAERWTNQRRAKDTGVTPVDLMALLEAQGNRCAICRKGFGHQVRIHADHCHRNSEPRGLLCVTCNLGIGYLGDTAASVLRAYNYLNQFEKLQEEPYMANSENVLTPRFRVSYPYIFQKGKAMDGGEAKYSVVMLFEKGADLSKLEAAVEAVCIEKWGVKSKWPKNMRSPFRDQGEKDDKSGYVEGCVFVTATSKQKPGLVDAKLQDIIEEQDFYPGCYARASVRPYAYDQAGNRGVSFGLQNVQKLAEGEPLTGRSKPTDDFEAVDGEVFAS